MAQPPIDIPIEFGKKFIVIEIGRKETKVEAYGFTGSSCKPATRPFLDALGGKVTGDQDKAEEATDGLQINA